MGRVVHWMLVVQRRRRFLDRRVPFLEIVEKLILRFVGLRMTDHLAEELRRHGDDIGAGHEGVVDIADVPDAADDDFRWHRALLEYAMHALDDRTGVIADIPDAAVEEAHEVGACRRSHYRLVERHAAGAVDADAPRFKLADDRQFVPSDRHLDVKALIFAKLSNELGCLLHHRLRVGGEDLYAQGNLAVIAFAQFDDALDMQFEIGAILFGHNRRIGRDSGRKTAPQRLFNLDQICRINEDFHSTLPGFSSRRTIYMKNLESRPSGAVRRSQTP